MLVFLFLVALAVVGFAAGRMRRAPAFLDGAALAGVAAVTVLASSHILALVVGLLCLAGGFVGGAAQDVKRLNRGRLGRGDNGLLNR